MTDDDAPEYEHPDVPADGDTSAHSPYPVSHRDVVVTVNVRPILANITRALFDAVGDHHAGRVLQTFRDSRTTVLRVLGDLFAAYGDLDALSLADSQCDDTPPYPCPTRIDWEICERRMSAAADEFAGLLAQQMGGDTFHMLRAEHAINLGADLLAHGNAAAENAQRDDDLGSLLGGHVGRIVTAVDTPHGPALIDPCAPDTAGAMLGPINPDVADATVLDITRHLADVRAAAEVAPAPELPTHTDPGKLIGVIGPRLDKRTETGPTRGARIDLIAFDLGRRRLAPALTVIDRVCEALNAQPVTNGRRDVYRYCATERDITTSHHRAGLFMTGTRVQLRAVPLCSHPCDSYRRITVTRARADDWPLLWEWPADPVTLTKLFELAEDWTRDHNGHPEPDGPCTQMTYPHLDGSGYPCEHRPTDHAGYPCGHRQGDHVGNARGHDWQGQR